MYIPKSLEFLQLLSAGNQFSPDDLDELINNKVSEDQYIEYKNGNELGKDDAKNTIRKYMSGFANSNGGILIFGIDAPHEIPIEVTGCKNTDKVSPEWVSRCLTPIAHLLSPQPQIHVVNHTKGKVLVCAIQRSLMLVSTNENSKEMYYFRFGDQTLAAPDYLISDLIFGRRHQTILNVNESKIMSPNRFYNQNDNVNYFSFELWLNIENSGLVWVDNCIVGIICYVPLLNDFRFWSSKKPSNYLLSFVDTEPIRPDSSQEKFLHLFKLLAINKPFDVETLKISFEFPLCDEDSWLIHEWDAVVYILTKDNIPQWFQISFRFDSDAVNQIIKDKQITSPNQYFSVMKTFNTLPKVTWKMTKQYKK